MPYLQRFQQQLVDPAAARTCKAKSAADKAIAVAKVLWGRLAKVPGHKQPVHAQFLPSALRESGKRQLDCLGIATAVLAVCQQLGGPGGPEPQLAGAHLMVSDDHVWLAVTGESVCACMCVCVCIAWLCQPPIPPSLRSPPQAAIPARRLCTSSAQTAGWSSPRRWGAGCMRAGMLCRAARTRWC